jgi:hypothetical protein
MRYLPARLYISLRAARYHRYRKIIENTRTFICAREKGNEVVELFCRAEARVLGPSAETVRTFLG